jgi:hypothetical protein
MDLVIWLAIAILNVFSGFFGMAERISYLPLFPPGPGFRSKDLTDTDNQRNTYSSAEQRPSPFRIHIFDIVNSPLLVY